MRLMVCPRTSVGEYRDAPVTHFVSLIDPDEVGKELPLPRSTEKILQLVFSDIDDVEIQLPKFKTYTPPREKDVAHLIDFGKSLASGEDWGLLAHCEAGISRSTAAAITMLTAAGYPPQVAFGIVRKVCPEMLPNRRMLRLADEILGTRGVLNKMAENHRRKAFERAGYEDPTEVLLAEFKSQKEKPKGFFSRLFSSILPAGWRNMVGSGARQRAMIERKRSMGSAR